MELSDPVGSGGIGTGTGSASTSGVGTGQNVEMVQLVRVARQELAGVISTLTELLATVRMSDTEGNVNGANGNATNDSTKKQLDDMLKRFETLRKSVNAAISAHDNTILTAKTRQNQVPEDERMGLMQKRAKLIAEVHGKNIKVRVLISQLRELQRDILALPTPYYKQNPSRK